MLHNSQKDFIGRHIGPSDNDQQKMLKDLNFKSLDDLINSTVPEKIQFKGELNIGDSNSEYEALRKLKAISKKNQIYSNFIGMGYYGTYTPYVIYTMKTVKMHPMLNLWQYLRIYILQGIMHTMVEG